MPTTPPWSTALWIRLWKPIPVSIPCSTATGGSAYATQIFHDKLASAGITQSMSRVGKCIDNSPMEGFWGILKRDATMAGGLPARNNWSV